MNRKRKSDAENNHSKSLKQSDDGDDSCTHENSAPFSKTSVDIAKKMRDAGCPEAADLIEEENIGEDLLPVITPDLLSKHGISSLKKQLEVLKVIRGVCSRRYYNKNDYKVFNDPIHGHIELHPLCVKIIDTIQFQRLRYLKQLGACYFVYPGASHNRFEHSLGVCHLAGLLIRAIRTKQPELDITEKDILCVEIAGLCHDLGHGPFSHLFDNKFIPIVTGKDKWKHEEASIEMFDYLIKENGLDEEFKKYGLTDVDKDFIKEQIAGPRESEVCGGRSERKSFLYEIVANKRNGVDVDKWDYFARDCHMLGITNNFDHLRYIKFARVLKVKGEYQICCRDKEVANLYDMFHTRSSLHRRAYQHSVNRCIEAMITEALVKANNHIKIKKSDGTDVKMSETILKENIDAYQQMTDDIFHQILWSTESELDVSRAILRRIMTRQLYKCVGQAKPKPGTYIDSKETQQIKRDMLNYIHHVENGRRLLLEDLVIDLAYLDYAMKEKDPLDKSPFYKKDNPDVPVKVSKDEVFGMFPRKFSEQVIRLICKKTDDISLGVAKAGFERWSQQNGHLMLGDSTTLDDASVEPSDRNEQEMAVTPQRPIGMPVAVSAGKFRSHLQFE